MIEKSSFGILSRLLHGEASDRAICSYQVTAFLSDFLRHCDIRELWKSLEWGTFHKLSRSICFV